MVLALAWQDYSVVLLYVAVLVGMGWWFARRQHSTNEYFLASRQVPWFALGLSIMATLMSSLTYLSEPGEVWLSGLTSIVGKWLAILTEMVVVLWVIIPFLMRFRFTSAYEYLEYRFSVRVRVWGVLLFVCLIVSWMGFVVLAMSWTVSRVTGVPLLAVTATVGLIGTIYTMVGGMRAVIWKEVLQVALMLGGCLVCIGFVWFRMGHDDWLATAQAYQHAVHPTRESFVFSLDPFERITVLSFAATMFVWHLCTHLGNQMVVQRYFSSSDLRAARRSFLLAALTSLLVNTLLIVAGIGLVAYYLNEYGDRWFDPYKLNKRDADLIFPMFMVRELPAGLAGAVLTAVLSAAMSTVDSGVNAIATVISTERNRLRRGRTGGLSEMRFARLVTLGAGLLITVAAYWLNMLVRDRNILEMMPRSFNCFLVPLGGMFFLGFFVPRCGPKAVLVASFAALSTAVGLAYSREFFGISDGGRSLSFTLILPSAFLVLVVVGFVGSLVNRSTTEQHRGLTWFSRHERPALPDHLLADPGPERS